MTTIARVLLLLASIPLLLACGSFADPTTWGKSSEVAVPASLVDFEATLQPDELWSHRIGGGRAQSSYNLRPRVEGEQVYVAGANGVVEALENASGVCPMTESPSLPILTPPCAAWRRRSSSRWASS